ncbi:GNAT family N-acetyltransferase [Fictibacillus sp. Mic-4]|uniref:GNAT family N-acetyltransferase n=1 Tax=Fictibacillus sp. Mic-4 TaxID=3132826 RepID=UPI003CFB5E5F
MKGNVHLIKPTFKLQDEYLSFYEEWKDSGEEMIPRVIKREPYPFKELVQFLRDSESGENLPDSYVPHSTYWLVNEGKKIIGAVNIRHELNEKLLNSGGHIGYGIRPSERRKGYATRLLTLALEKTKEMGLKKVLVCCNKDNIGSERTILKNGGVFENEYIEDDGNIVRRFWVLL